ncbi:MAG: C39 family peptidase, partial [Victivallales bacterium]|jgi:hypothetical protein|nr:C39 family peptidase [Victivallales bacterium]
MKGQSLTLFGLKTKEVIFDLKDGKISALNVSIYNRGDAGVMSERAFKKQLDDVQDKIQQFAGTKNRPQSQRATMDDSKLRSMLWRTNDSDIVLKWSISKDLPEYINIDFYRPGESPKDLKSGIKTTVASSALPSLVKHESDGSNYMLIPMVDQGAKGYCVAATVERILRYYGSNIDQHVIATLAKSDAQKGTNINKIIDVLESNSGKLGIRFKPLYRYELDNYDDLKKMIKYYNAAARREKADKIDLDDYISNRRFDFGRMMKSMNFKVFKEVRARETRDNKLFLEEIKKSIDNGIPLCWSTFIFPSLKDTSSNEFGMHMRIITGYNSKTGEIIFSDSWGAGHEKKTLKDSDAWAITVNLVSLEPRRR